VAPLWRNLGFSLASLRKSGLPLNLWSSGKSMVSTLRRYLGGRQPDISDVARELGMSSRTLQRRIADEGTNFRRILNQVRAILF